MPDLTVGKRFCRGGIFGAVIGGIAGVFLSLFGDLTKLGKASPRWFWVITAILCGIRGASGALKRRLQRDQTTSNDFGS